MNEVNKLSSLGRPQGSITLSELAGYPTTRVLNKKEWILRRGIGTLLGDIEVSLWRTLVKDAIARKGEEKFHAALQIWCRENGRACGYVKVSDYALALYCDRVFLDRGWPGYQRYRQILTKVNGKGDQV